MDLSMVIVVVRRRFGFVLHPCCVCEVVAA